MKMKVIAINYFFFKQINEEISMIRIQSRDGKIWAAAAI